jgi:hypothetical protein
MQIHRRRWICAGDCNSSFTTKARMERHMREEHEGEFAELQLPILFDICKRPAELEEVTNCPLCPEISRLSRMQNHLATHLEDLALFVLPIGAGDRFGNAGSGEAEFCQNEPSRLEMDGPSSLGTF